MSDARPDDENVIFITACGTEMDFMMDTDGDFLIQITDDSKTEAFYLNPDQALELRDWLLKRLS